MLCAMWLPVIRHIIKSCTKESNKGEIEKDSCKRWVNNTIKQITMVPSFINLHLLDLIHQIVFSTVVSTLSGLENIFVLWILHIKATPCKFWSTSMINVSYSDYTLGQYPALFYRISISPCVDIIHYLL